MTLYPKISLLITNYNASHALKQCLSSIINQTVKVKEIIVIDNHSTDDSIDVVKMFSKNIKDCKIRLIVQNKNKGQMASYIKGIEACRYNIIITMHSDGKIASRRELHTLLQPLLQDTSIIAAYPTILHTEEVWNQYDFWQKLSFCRVVGTQEQGLNGKFDAFRKEYLLKIVRNWERRFRNTNIAGGEDWDLYSLMKKEGIVVATTARVIHLHQVGSFSFHDLLIKRKHIARTYGKLLNLYGLSVGIRGVTAFLLKPLLALSIIVFLLTPYAILPIVLYSIFYYRKMYTTWITLSDNHIILLPFITIFLVFYEAYWTIQSYVVKGD